MFEVCKCGNRITDKDRQLDEELCSECVVWRNILQNEDNDIDSNFGDDYE